MGQAFILSLGFYFDMVGNKVDKHFCPHRITFFLLNAFVILNFMIIFKFLFLDVFCLIFS